MCTTTGGRQASERQTGRATGRREVLKYAAAGLVAGTALGRPGRAFAAAKPIDFSIWSAAVDTVKSHITGFEKKTGIKVNLSTAPWAQYRESMIAKFVGGAPVDALWVSDSWLPEWVEAGWLAPIGDFPSLTQYNRDVDDFCVTSTTYNRQQYCITYYTDYMA